MDRRLISPALLLIAFSAGCLLPGCGDSSEGEFRSYSELQSQDPAPEQDQVTGEPNGALETGPTTPLENAASEPDGTGRATAAGPEPDPIAGDVSHAAQPGRQSARPTDEEFIEADAAAAAINGTPAEPVASIEPQADEQPVEAPRPEPREIKLLVPHQTFRVEGPEEAIRVSYDDIDLLKVLNMEPVPADCVAHFPDWLRNLDGRRIRIRGFMFPPFETTGIRGFVLARDNQICCFGRNPKRYDVIDVFMRNGVTTDYIQNRPFDVVGVFHIQPEDDDGELYQLYVIDDAIVIDH
jgi:hypothetical protein